MLFSSITFLYYFLPIVLFVYFISPAKLRNLVLLISSIIFYAWGEPKYLVLMLVQVFFGWFFGLLIEKWRGRSLSRLALILAIVIEIGVLMYYKYADFFIANSNSLLGTNIPLLRLALPLGISFYTFQILSYDMDLYGGSTKVQRNPLTFATYVTLFPQLIAGPIVRYVDVEKELQSRTHTVEQFASGAMRFVVGLGKKVLIANVLGEFVSIYKASGDRSLLFVWLYAFAYALQIYFDFSGYSDMAIGMGRMFGFKFLENFNYPFTARSITDFWRRWHMSMATWFRDYVYIPLGGNRVKKARYIFNVMFIWFLTGFWHGAGWNFMLWGLYFGVLLLIEKLVLGKILEKLPKFVGHIYLILLLQLSWGIFDANSLTEALTNVTRMFGIGTNGLWGPESLYYLRSYAVILILAIIGSTPLVARLAKKLPERALMVAEPLCILMILIMVTGFLADGSFNPFIYFRF